MRALGKFQKKYQKKSKLLLPGKTRCLGKDYEFSKEFRNLSRNEPTLTKT